MNRLTQSSILVFSGLALLLAVVSAAFDWRVALGAAAVAGACAVWAALMSTAGSQPSQQVCAQGAPASVGPAAPDGQAERSRDRSYASGGAGATRRADPGSR